MDGQLNLFDYMNEQEPQILPEYSVRLFFLDGFSYVYEYDKPYVGMWDKEIAQHGIIVDYNIIRGGMNPTLKTPCFRHCDVEWCSLSCFLKRGVSSITGPSELRHVMRMATMSFEGNAPPLASTHWFARHLPTYRARSRVSSEKTES